MSKLLIICPHLSTGGAPQYCLDYLKHHKQEYSEIKLIEFTEFSSEYVIQKNKIIQLLGEENVFTLGEYHSKTFNKDKEKLIPIVENYSPDVIWMNEMPEAYEYKLPPNTVMDFLYSLKRKHKIIETTHFNAFDFSTKTFIPDEFLFCSPKHINESKHLNIPKKVWQTPIKNNIRPNREDTLKNLNLDPSKYHILNVGLINSNKNQKYIFDLAEKTQNLPIEYHFIGNHCFIEDTGISDTQKSLANCKLWGEKDNVNQFMSCMDLYLFPSLKELNPLTVKEALSWDMDVVANYDENYTDQYKDYKNFNVIQEIDVENFIKSKILCPEFLVSFINGPKIEIIDPNSNNEYLIKFIDNKTHHNHYETILKGGYWGASDLKYFIDWKIEVYNNNNKIYEHNYNAKNKKILINFDSKAIGDTLAWFPYVEEFRKKHQCKVVVSTFHNSWFKNKYPDIDFVKPGEIVHNLYAQYNIGWFYNNDDSINYKKVPINFRLNVLGKTCSSTLGLEYKELKPLLSFNKTSPIIKDPYICIAPHASALAKYWNYSNGWQELIDYFNSKGYKVMMITGEPLGDDWHDSKLGGKLKNVIDRTGKIPFGDIANDLMNAKAFIGVSSGLSWLSWALGCNTTIISGFTQPLTEMEDCNRISTPLSEICNGCFSYNKLDAGDWEWCPEHKDTFRQFECTKSILPSTVIESLNQQLKIS
tara:strand:+ start:2551 stop:4653 length:2103 start_codon:yes stop_codon:yes gene_type:complete